MNPNSPTPEDPDLTARSAQIEQRLKQHQPQPLSLTAEEVLLAATRQPSPAALRPTPWFTLAMACASGAIAGALLTFVVMRTAPAPTTTAADIGAGITDANPQRPVAPPEAPPQVVESHLPPESAAPLDSNWSVEERLLAGQMRELHRPRHSSSRPLTAGNLRFLATADKPHSEALVFAHLRSSDRVDQPAGASAEDPSPPTTSLDTNPLLEELLGSDFQSL